MDYPARRMRCGRVRPGAKHIADEFAAANERAVRKRARPGTLRTFLLDFPWRPLVRCKSQLAVQKTEASYACLSSRHSRLAAINAPESMPAIYAHGRSNTAGMRHAGALLVE